MDINQLVVYIKSGGIDKSLSTLYNNEEIEFHRQRYNDIITKLNSNFGCSGEVMLFSTPGRTELAGNHTDHQQGKVLAGAVSLDIIAAVQINDKNLIRIKSEGHILCEVELDELDAVVSEQGSATALVRGIASEISKRGFTLCGFDAYTTSMVLRGSGLSSSAAFEVLIATIINHLSCEKKLTPLELAQISQRAENIFYNKPCGLMDQTACSVGAVVAINFVDPENPLLNGIDFNLEQYGYKLVIVNTKGNHGDLTDDYTAIPAEMKAVAGLFQKEHLSEISEQQFYTDISRIRNNVGDRATLRAIHYFNENRRVDKIVTAIQKNDIEEFFKQIRLSGQSSISYLQNIYSTKDPHSQGISIGLALTEQFLGDDGGFRVHGGGFAGTIQAYVKIEQVEAYKALIDNVFGAKSCYGVNLRKQGGVRVY